MRAVILAIALTLAAASAQIVEVTVTYYHPVEWQTDDTPHIASCGHIEVGKKRLQEGWRLVALSRDLFFDELGRKRCGQLVFVQVEGEAFIGVVYDTMHPRFSNWVDVLMDVGEHAEWGKAGGTLEFVDGY